MAKHYGTFKFTRDVGSQIPALILIRNGWEITILGRNIKPFDHNDPTKVFSRVELDDKKMNNTAINNVCRNTLGHSCLDNADASKLRMLGTNVHSPKNFGLRALTFTAKNQISKRWIGKGERKADLVVDSLVVEYRKGTIVSLFRRL
jgi:hypothetical protein